MKVMLAVTTLLFWGLSAMVGVGLALIVHGQWAGLLFVFVGIVDGGVVWSMRDDIPVLWR